MRRRLLPAARTAAALLLGACATREIVSIPSDVAQRIPFLRAGETSRRETFDRLGDPAHRHDADGVFVWNAGVDQDGRLRILDAGEKRTIVPASWRNAGFEVVLQFDAAGTYVRGSLVHAE